MLRAKIQINQENFFSFPIKDTLNRIGVDYIGEHKNFEDCKKKAKKNDLNANYNLGLYYLFGDGVEQSLEKALLCFYRGVRKDHVPSIFMCGYLLSRTHHNKKIQSAVYAGIDMVWHTAKKYKYTPALLCLGLDSHVGGKYEDAKGYFKQALEAKSQFAFFFILELFKSINNKTTSIKKRIKNEKELFELLKIASSLKEGSALYALGNCYEQGMATAKNLNLALEYWLQASALGTKAADGKLGQYARELSEYKKMREPMPANNKPLQDPKYLDKKSDTPHYENLFNIELLKKALDSEDNKKLALSNTSTSSAVSTKDVKSPLEQCLNDLKHPEELVAANYLLSKLKKQSFSMAYDQLSIEETIALFQLIELHSEYKSDINGLLHATKNQGKVFLSLSRKMGVKFLLDLKGQIKRDPVLSKRFENSLLVAEIKKEEQEKLNEQIKLAKNQLQLSYQNHYDKILDVITVIESRSSFVHADHTKTFLAKVGSFEKLKNDLKSLNECTQLAISDDKFLEKISSSHRWLISIKEKLDKLFDQLKRFDVQTKLKEEAKSMKKIPYNKNYTACTVADNKNVPKSKEKPSIKIVDHKQETNIKEEDHYSFFNEVIPNIIMTMLPISLDGGQVKTPRDAFIGKLKELLLICKALPISVKYSSDELMWKPFIEKCKATNLDAKGIFSEKDALELGKFALQIQKNYTNSLKPGFFERYTQFKGFMCHASEGWHDRRQDISLVL